jgi:hypothetical protein
VHLGPHYLEAFHPRWAIIQIVDSDFASDAFNSEKRHFSRAPNGEIAIVEVLQSQRQGANLLLWEARERSSFVGYAAVRAWRFREAMSKEAPLFHASKVHGSATDNPIERAADWPLDAEFALLRDAWEGRLTILYLPELDPHDAGRKSEIGRWLEERCRKTGTSFVSLADAFPDFLARGHSPYGFNNTKFNEGHMNAAGHAAAAALLAHELERLGVP